MKPFQTTYLLLFAAICLAAPVFSQNFYLGADLSYVNEMEDCGVDYKENNIPKDPYQIFADHNCNLVRLRLWHSPKWYDALDSGNRYSDFNDVRRSIVRAKASNMKVLLDFHLSDSWADPSNQVVPKAWEPIVNNLPVLKDSLYNYIYSTLISLDSEGLLPEMVQIGNETNRGILVSPQENAAGWSLNWARNSELFKRAIEAVRNVETATGKTVKVALHIAGPTNADWLMQGFWNNGVRDFDVIGLSYYWAWHKPTTIANTGAIVTQLKQQYPGKEVMIFETGYIWTFNSNDNANNIINVTNPDYAPTNPENQKKWLVDLTTEMIDKGAAGVVYWEPAWISSPCHTQWGQGSHQENAAFFDFQSNLLTNGGMEWMAHDYGLTKEYSPFAPLNSLTLIPDSAHRKLLVSSPSLEGQKDIKIQLAGKDGRILSSQSFAEYRQSLEFSMPVACKEDIYFVMLVVNGQLQGTGKFFWKR